MKDTFITGKIDSNLIGDFKNIDYPGRRQFRDDETVERWKNLGHLYVNYTGFIREEYRGLPDWCENIILEIKKQLNVCNTSCSLYCMPPGTIMPEHQDAYLNYKKIFNIGEVDKICRILVFMDDWKSGHYFEVCDNPIINWKSGDYCMWIGNTPHIAANIGRENRYTLQITATIDDE
jgi:hypothetical protein